MNTPLSILRRLNNQKRPSAWKRHPTVEETEEFRLRYLAAVAFFLVLERAPSAAERDGFVDFCATLNIQAQEACEQFDMRDSLNGEAFLEIISALKSIKMHWILITDVIWLQLTLGEQRPIDKSALFEACLLLEIPGNSWENISKVLIELRNHPKRTIDFYSEDKRLPSGFFSASKKIIKKLISEKIERNINAAGLFQAIRDRLETQIKEIEINKNK